MGKKSILGNHSEPSKELLAQLGLVSEEEIEKLTKTTRITRENWAKRRQFAPRIKLGNARYYPLAGLRSHIEKLLADKC